MLDPEYLEQAGDLVVSVYSQMEDEMVDELVSAMLKGDISEWRMQTALALMSQGEATKLRAILEKHRNEINDAVRKEIETALLRSDSWDLEIIKAALGVTLPEISSVQIAGVVKTVCEMLERDNLDMIDGARDAMYRESSWALTQVGAGFMSPDAAVKEATQRLAGEGITMVQYKDPTTGEKTVRNRVDVAVRRHIRSQLNQACNTRTLQVCQETGCGFVEVSSHFGARPSHQDWEGRCYALKGPVTVDGVTYEDFGQATGYYGEGDHGALGDRLCGVNCRHSFGPWMPGMPHAYHPNPQHPSGKSNDEIYELTQKQRALERRIRSTKRKLSAAMQAYEQDPSLENQVLVNKLKAKLKAQNDEMKQLCADNSDVLTRQVNREYTGDMPRVNVPKASGRTIDEYLESPEAAQRLKAAGISKTAAKSGFSRVSSDMGISGGFASLSKANQDLLANEVILPKTKESNRSIPVGGQFGIEPSPLEIINIESRLVPETTIQETVVFAGSGTSTEYRKRNALSSEYGGEPLRWSHNAGYGWIFDPIDGTIRKAELHWAEEPSAGIHELRFKGWVES